MRNYGLPRILPLAEGPAPASKANTGHVYTKDVGAITEAFYMDSAGAEIQLTSGGTITGSATFPVGFIDGLGLVQNSTTKVDIVAGSCRDSGNTANMALALAATVDLDAATGFGAIDALPAKAADTFYFIWLVSDSAGVNPSGGIASLSATAPTMPAGYDLKRLQGAILTDAGKLILPFRMTGEGRNRRFDYESQILIVSDTATTVLFKHQVTTAQIPSIATLMIVGIQWTDELGTFYNTEISLDGTAIYWDGQHQGSAFARANVVLTMPLSDLDGIYHATTVANKIVTFYAHGYHFTV